MQIHNSPIYYPQNHATRPKENPLSTEKATEGFSDTTDKRSISAEKNETNHRKSESSTHEGKYQSPTQLKDSDLEIIETLKKRDREVRTHEAAHLAAAGQHATSGIKLDYQRGPDGKNYAVGGEVSIDTSEVPNDPEATLKKAQQIQAAALAPAEPSNQDRQVAASAAKMATKARSEISGKQQEELRENGPTEKPDKEEDNTIENSEISKEANSRDVYTNNAIRAYEDTEATKSTSTTHHSSGVFLTA